MATGLLLSRTNSRIYTSHGILIHRFVDQKWMSTARRCLYHLSCSTEKKRTAGLRYNVLGNYRYYRTTNPILTSQVPLLVACDIRYSQILNYHLSSRRHDDAKSIADKTVQILSETKKKEQEKLEKEKQQQMRDKEDGVIPTASQSAEPSAVDSSKVEVKHAVDASKLEHGQQLDTPLQNQTRMQRIWRKVVKEAKHYYNGFRLLFIDVKICTRYVWGVLNGKTLTRRERKQLVRTTADLFRLVPFMVFIIVPFMEFLLPVALKLFPGLLPSTFAEVDKEKEKVKKRLKAKLEIAKFLQDTVEESALVKSGTGKHTELAKEFKTLLKQIREDGTTVETSDITRFSQLFSDDITLDNMTRDHLTALARLLELNTIGTNKMIAFQLRVKLRQLKADDKLIAKEGLGTLSVSELQQACRSRGMRAIGVPEWRLRYQLKQWLDMHLNDKIPLSLLLMSRALYLPDTLSKEEQLKTIISSLPENTTAEAAVHAAAVTGEKVDNAAKLALFKAEEEAIAREKAEEAAALREEMDKKAQAQQAKTEQTEKAKVEERDKAADTAAPKPVESEILSAKEDLAKHTIVDKAEPIEATSKADVVYTEPSAVPSTPPASAVPSTPVSTTTTTTESIPDGKVLEDVAKVLAKDEEISQKDIEELEDVLEAIAEEKRMQLEMSSLKELKGDVEEYQEDLSQLKSLVEMDAQIIESKSAKRLSSAVNRMISNLSIVTDDLHRQKQQLLEDIEVKQVKIRRSEELQNNEEALQNLQDAIEKEKDDVITINELVLSMKRLQKIDDDTRLQKIAEVLDEDNDGQIQISHVLRVLQEIGTENVNIKGAQMSDIIDLLKKETELQNEEKVNSTVKVPSDGAEEISIDTPATITSEAQSKPQEKETQV